MAKFKNSFKDNGRAVVNTKANTIFWYSFSADAHVIAEAPDQYRFATEKESSHLESLFDRNRNRRVFRLPRKT